MQERDDILQRVCETARRAYWLRLTPATAGNISIRMADNRMLISSSGTCMGDMRTNDLTPHPSSRGGASQVASSEAPLHAALYEVRSDAHSILHYHGCWSVLAAEMADGDAWFPRMRLPEFANFSGGEAVHIVPPLPPGSSELAEEAARLAGESRPPGLLLRGHGAIVWGQSPEDALYAAEVLEQTALLEWSNANLPE